MATDVGAFSELVSDGDEETGLIIRADDLKAMVNGAAVFMDNLPRLAAAGANGLARTSKNFAIEAEAQAIGAVYEKLMR